MRKVLCGVFGCLAFFLNSGSSLRAAEYSVEWTKNGEGSQVVDIVSGEVNPTRWHTINDPSGVNLRNAAGFRIKSIRIKAVAADVTFRVVSPSADAVFPTVWKRKDNTEVAFLDGDIAMNAFVWNRVNDTSGASGTTGNIFEGQIFRENFTIPDPQNWEQVPHEFVARVPGRWKELVRSLPEQYIRVDAYAESEDGNRVFFISRGFPFVYDFKADELRSVLIPRLIPRGINQLRLTKNDLEFWKDGSNVYSMPLDHKARYGEVLKKGERR